VELGRGEPPSWQPAAAGDALGAGDRVRTGEDGRAEIALERSTLRLYPNSLLRLPEASAGEAVLMQRGTSLFDVLRRGESFEVRTPEVVVSVKGTRFAVALGEDDAASVSVYRGLVGVRADTKGARETLVQAGFAAFGRDSFELTWHGADDPWEGWSRSERAPDPFLGRGVEREAALRDARAAALALSQELPRPPEAGADKRVRPRDAGSALPPAAPGDDASGRGKPDAAPVLRDPVADADGALGVALQEEYSEDWVNRPDAGGAVPVEPLEIEFLGGSGVPGPDVVQVLGGSSEWTFRKDDLNDVLEGEDSLPADLTALLAAQGIEEDAFASQLLSLFTNGKKED
jgi:hypothetical protein